MSTTDSDAWQQISPRYLVEALIKTIGYLLGPLAVTSVPVFVDDPVLEIASWYPLALVSVIGVVALVLVPARVRSYGYQLRADDVVFRRGVLYRRMVAVPYGRLQLVDISRGPLSRILGLAELRLVTAAASTGVTIPGLPRDVADQLRDHLISVAETRRAGL